jgi:hypothetical protein
MVDRLDTVRWIAVRQLNIDSRGCKFANYHPAFLAHSGSASLLALLPELILEKEYILVCVISILLMIGC